MTGTEIRFPLTLSQQDIYFGQLHYPDSPHYNIGGYIKLIGCDVDKLKAAHAKLIHNSDVFGIRICSTESGVFQEIVPVRTTALELLDMRDQNDPRQKAIAWITDILISPFELEQSELFKAAVVQVRKDEFWYVFIAHHIMQDGWGFANLAHRLGRFYNGADVESDFIWRQIVNDDISYQNSDRYERDKSFWQERLKNPPEQIFSPDHLSTRAKQDFHDSGRILLEINNSSIKLLNEICSSRKVSFQNVLLACISLYFGSISNRKSLLIGTPYHNRNGAQKKRSLGVFTNFSPLLVDLEGLNTIGDLASRLASEQRMNLRHQRFPIGHLVHGLSESRHRIKNYEIVFNYLKLDSEFLVGEAQAELNFLPNFNSKEPIIFTLWEYGKSLPAEIQIDYRKEYFSDSEAQLLQQRIGHLIDVILQDGHLKQKTEMLDFLPESEKLKILDEFNSETFALPDACFVHKEFEKWATWSPDAVALTFGAEHISYSELNRIANQLAFHLIERGLGPDDIIAVYLNRSVELIVALLAIQKSGAAYLPLDPSHPEKRNIEILSRSQAVLVLTDSRQLDAFVGGDTQQFDMACDLSFSEASVEDPELKNLSDRNLVYVIYTSGSTGVPKGVMLEHRSVYNRISWMLRNFRISFEDSVLHKTPIIFDVSFWEIMWPLCSGARLVIAKPEGHRDSQYLCRLIQDESITATHFIPSMLRNIIADPDWKYCRSLVNVFCSGEALPDDLASEFFETSNARLHNLYGPTEAAIEVSHHEVDRGQAARVTIGRPIQNVRLLVLLGGEKIAPIGVPGDLYIAGLALARGYLGDEELTSECFREVNFGLGDSIRAYKTGDLAKWSNDGQLIFLGRSDDQIKINGVRLEVGEIESRLRNLERVVDAAVVACGDSSRVHSLLAAVVFEGNADTPDSSEMRAALSQWLPQYMLPNRFIVLDMMPRTSSGKIDRKKIQELGVRPPRTHSTPKSPHAREAILLRIWQRILKVESLGTDENFFEAGGNSLIAVDLLREINRQLNCDLRLTDIFAYPTISRLAKHISGMDMLNPDANIQLGESNQRRLSGSESETEGGVAIVGLACRFPDADHPDHFWENLVSGHESLRFFTDDELRDAGVTEDEIRSESYIKAGYVLPGVKEFDAEFFGFSPREAELLDPQQRLLFECVQEALEHSGYAKTRNGLNAGVFVGVGINKYFQKNILPNRQLYSDLGETSINIGNLPDHAATRISYKLNLTGPSVCVGTACSTSLVAVHLARRSLLEGACDVALAGASSLWNFAPTGYPADQGGIASQDGHCRAFDQDASGTRPGSGAGVFVLKRLADAISDRDPILAVIKGSAINNDGDDKVGYTAPSVRGQTNVIRDAIENAGLKSSDVDYVEAHGTGTHLGDPIELKALELAFSEPREFPCFVGSIKPNVGHLDSAAGVAGLMKACLMILNRKIPPQLNFLELNSEIQVDPKKISVKRDGHEFEVRKKPLRVGVSSFGIGGTNAHVILEEPVSDREVNPGREQYLFPISTRHSGSIGLFCDRLKSFFEKNRNINLADSAYSLTIGREEYQNRGFIVAGSSEELVQRLGQLEKFSAAGNTPVQSGPVFMFSGQGSQHPKMFGNLYRTEKVFRENFDRCAGLVRPEFRRLLFDIISDRPGSSPGPEIWRRTDFVQPLLFIFEYSLAQVFLSLGVVPRAVIGHSLGEYVAACIAGAISLEDALFLVTERGRLMQSIRPGKMLAVGLPANDIAQISIEEKCDIAASNSSGACVVSGSAERLARLKDRLEREKSAQAMFMPTEHAFHSAHVDPILQVFEERIRNIKFKTPQIPMISNLTGTYISGGDLDNVRYWSAHMRSTVKFKEGIESLLEDDSSIFLEIGPGKTLCSFVSTMRSGVTSVSCVPGRRGDESSTRVFLSAIGRLWQSGVQMDLSRLFDGEIRRRVHLPAQPFIRKRFWIDASLDSGGDVSFDEAIIFKPNWVRERYYEQCDSLGDEWAVTGLALSEAQSVVETIERTSKNASLFGWENFFNEASDTDFGGSSTRFSKCQNFLVNLASPESDRSELKITEDSMDLAGFMDNIRALVLRFLQLSGNPLRVGIITFEAFNVLGAEKVQARYRMIQTLMRIFTQEYPHIEFRLIDVDRKRESVSKAVEEMVSAQSNNLDVAYRNGVRWTNQFQKCVEKKIKSRESALRHGGSYVITGGMGRIGVVLASFLIRKYDAKVALLGRRIYPTEEIQSRLVSTAAEFDTSVNGKKESGDDFSERFIRISANVSDEKEMSSAFAEVKRKFGEIDGVIHCAGVPKSDPLPLSEYDVNALEHQFTAKIDGVRVLDALLKDQDIQFFLLMSSLSAELGGVGYSGYGCANAYLNAFAEKKHNSGDFRWSSIAWEAWDIDGEKSFPGEGLYKYSMSARRGSEIFQTIVCKGMPAYLVSCTGDIAVRMGCPGDPDHVQLAPESQGNRPLLDVEYIEPRFELEMQVAELWVRFLGINKIGVLDDFFSLGGDSLMLIRMLSELNRNWNSNLSLQDVFEHPTVSAIAAKLASNLESVATVSPDCDQVEEIL